MSIQDDTERALHEFGECDENVDELTTRKRNGGNAWDGWDSHCRVYVLGILGPKNQN